MRTTATSTPGNVKRKTFYELIHKKGHTHTHTQSDLYTEKQASRQSGRQTDQETDRRRDRQTGRQTERESESHKRSHLLCVGQSYQPVAYFSTKFAKVWQHCLFFFFVFL